jgi:hypothetical protein
MIERPRNRTGAALVRRTNKLREQGHFITTPERMQWMHDNYATCGLHITQIMEVLNDFPGAPITSDRQLHSMAARLGVKREGGLDDNNNRRGFHIVTPDVWSNERKQYLADNWMAKISIHELLKQLNEIPASKPIGGYKAVQYQAKRMALPNRYPVHVALQRERAKTHNEKRNQERQRVWTPERCVLLRELWPQLLTSVQIKQMIETQHPGLPISTPDAIRRQANAMGLEKRDGEKQRALLSMAVKEHHKNKRSSNPSAATVKKTEKIAAAKAAKKIADAYYAAKEIKAPPPKEQRPEFADNAINAKMEKARKLLKARKDPFDIHVAVKLPLREVYRLQAELKGRL